MKERFDTALAIVIVGAAAGIAPFVLGARLDGVVRYSLPIAILATGFLAYLVTRWEVRAKQRQVFGARPSIAPEALFEQYFRDTALRLDVFVSAWNECARILGVPADRLRPWDRFDRELAPIGFFDGIGHPLDDLFEWVARTHSSHQGVSALNNLETIGDLVIWIVQADASQASGG